MRVFLLFILNKLEPKYNVKRMPTTQNNFCGAKVFYNFQIQYEYKENYTTLQAVSCFLYNNIQ